MDMIVNLVGASGSGKTTIARELGELGYNVIQSYTTREPREFDEWGHTFIGTHTTFGDGEFPEKIVDSDYVYRRDEMIAYFKGYSAMYFATVDQYKGKGISIYIVDPNGATQVENNVNDAKVITIYLDADEVVRESRMVSRHSIDEIYQNHNDIISMVHDRLNSDCDIFKSIKCDYVVDANRYIDEIIKDVVEIIEQEGLS